MYFYFNTDKLPKITHMGRNITPGKWCHSARTSAEYILIIVLHGDLYIKENNIPYELHPGDILLIEPGKQHIGYKESTCDYYYIHISEEMFLPFDCSEIESIESLLLQNQQLYYQYDPYSYEFYEHAKIFIPKDMSITNHHKLSSITDKIDETIHAYERHDLFYKMLCSSKFIEIMSILSSCFSDYLFQFSDEFEGATSHNKVLQNLLDYLHESYSTKISGSTVALSLNMNFDYLNRLFKKQTGMTIFEYLQSIRINKAKELLLSDTMKCYEIAAATGFTNEYHFSRVFKNIVGVSPLKYKK